MSPKTKQMITGYSCAQAPIDSNHVVPAYDEHYRGDQTHVPQVYQNLCLADPDSGISTLDCSAQQGCQAQALSQQSLERFHGGRGGGRRGWYGRGGRGWYGGWPRWGTYSGGWWPRYDVAPVVITAPPAPAPSPSVSPTTIGLFGAFTIALILILRK